MKAAPLRASLQVIGDIDRLGSPAPTWLCAGADPAEVAQRAGNSVEVLLSRYAKCLYDRQSVNNQRIEGLLSAYDKLLEPDESDEE